MDFRPSLRSAGMTGRETMLDQLAARVNGDANLVRRGKHVTTTFLIQIDNADHLVSVAEGRITGIRPGPFITPNYSFALRASRELWDKLLVGEADSRLHRHLCAGEEEAAAHRGRPAPIHEQPHLLQGSDRGGRRQMSPRFEPAIGRYLHLDLLGRPHRLYVEEAGQGIPLLCLHTAGSDGRQYRGLLNDERITKNYRVIVFDMPWHGKSSPPVGWENEEYRLTSRDYVRMILDVSTALELDKPVVMGCSIGGRIVLHLAHEHPEKFRAIVGLEFRPRSILTTIRAGCTARTCMAAKSPPVSCRGLSLPRLPTMAAGKHCGTTCRADPVCLRATSIST